MVSLRVSRSTRSKIAFVTPFLAKFRWMKWLFVIRHDLMNRNETRESDQSLLADSQ